MSLTRNFAADDAPKGRILVIDDDPQMRALLVTFLRRDYRVSVASDGEEGYNKSKEHRPDIAIVDVQMPGWDGIATLQAFRDDRDLSGVKIVMLTADASRQTVMAAIAAGADDYMVKTALSKHDLLQKLRRVFKQQEAMKPSAVAVTTPAPQSSSGTPLFTPAPTAAPAAVAAPAATTRFGDGDIGTSHDPTKLQELIDAWE